MKACGYIRVSTPRQATEGESLAAQAADFGKFCEREGLEPVAVFRDVQSARTDKRPGLQEALRFLRQRRAKVLVVTDLDRAFRNAFDALSVVRQLQRIGADIRGSRQQLDRSTPEGRLVFNILATVAEWERERIAKRMADASRYRRSRGEAYCPKPALGERFDNGRVVADEAEQRVVERILRLRSEGKSFRRIAWILMRDRVPTKNGRGWYASTVRGICKRREAN